MKFAKVVFWIAGAFGLFASVGLYFQPGSPVYYGLIAGVETLGHGQVNSDGASNRTKLRAELVPVQILSKVSTHRLFFETPHITLGLIPEGLAHRAITL